MRVLLWEIPCSITTVFFYDIMEILFCNCHNFPFLVSGDSFYLWTNSDHLNDNGIGIH